MIRRNYQRLVGPRKRVDSRHDVLIAGSQNQNHVFVQGKLKQVVPKNALVFIIIADEFALLALRQRRYIFVKIRSDREVYDFCLVVNGVQNARNYAQRRHVSVFVGYLYGHKTAFGRDSANAETVFRISESRSRNVSAVRAVFASWYADGMLACYHAVRIYGFAFEFGVRDVKTVVADGYYYRRVAFGDVPRFKGLNL